MNGRTLFRLIGYGVSVLGVITGVLMLAGWVLGSSPAPLRQTFGVVLICYGIYRFLLLRMSRSGGAAGPQAGRAASGDRWERRPRWDTPERWDRADAQKHEPDPEE